jgi:hypothetical protein
MVHIPELVDGDTLKFTMFFDDGYMLYINGVLAAGVPENNWLDRYETIFISDAGKAAINYGGDNLFAMQVLQNEGGAYMDLGITAEHLDLPITHEEEPQAPVWKDIATPEDWLNIKNDLNGFYRLTADLDLYNTPYHTSIGDLDAPFRGYIDGQNHSILCPDISRSTDDRCALFGYAVGAHFVNLRFLAGYVNGQASSGGSADIAVLVARGKGITVEHVVFDDYIDPSGNVVPTEVTGRDHVGVVAGTLESGQVSTIKNVYVVNAKVETRAHQAGGLVGVMCDTRIINSYFDGTVAVTAPNYLDIDNSDASGIVSRIEGGKNQLTGVMSLASSIKSASGNEWVSFNGGGNIVIDSATCFTRDDMVLDPLKNPARGGQFARATDSMKRPEADFRNDRIYLAAGWDFVNVWGIPKGGGLPIFRYLGDEDDFEPVTDVGIPAVRPINDLRIYSTGSGDLVLTSSQPTAVWIYSLQGSLVERIDVDGSQIIALPRGIYIVKSVQNGAVKAVKIIN